MGLDLAAIGRTGASREYSWIERDTLLYALAVGAGQDPLEELAWTTENSEGITLEVIPSFGVVIAQQAVRPEMGDFDRSKLVHAEQHFELLSPLTASGTATSTVRVTAIEDKGTGAVVRTETETVNADTGDVWVRSKSAVFIRGEGGFGGDRGISPEWQPPREKPDHQVTMSLRPEQALIYRLTGDRNPLHSDPAFAARGGFDRPILHGMGTYGFTCRALARIAGPGARLTAMGGRFSAPVWPGDELSVQAWVDGDHVWFRTLRNQTQVVIDRGRATLTPLEG